MGDPDEAPMTGKKELDNHAEDGETVVDLT